MSIDTKKQSPLEKVATLIVDKRKAFYLIYILLIILSIFSANWVNVNDDMASYLPAHTETRKGLTVMEDEFVTYATANVMVDNISYDDAEKLCEEVEDIKGVKDVAFDDTTNHYSKGSALFSITFDGTTDDELCEEALQNVEKHLADYDIYVSAALGDASSERLAKEMNIVMILACVIILSVLFLSSRTYMEIPVLVMTFGVAAILGAGSNFIFGTVSYLSDSVAVIMQLALSIDYAIILCHRYLEERETNAPREAVITALCKAIPEISGSCLTTLSGLAAMGFMQFKIGFDLALVLIKSIIISIITVFTLMPGLLMSFSGLIDKTHHKIFIPDIKKWCNGVVKVRHITPYIFFAVIIVAFFLSNNCPYAYSYTNLTTFSKNETQIADEMIKETFTAPNVLAAIVPSGDYEKEQQLKEELESFSEVKSVTGLASTEAIDDYAIGDRLTPREFSELTDMDIEMVNFLYSAYAANEENYGRIVGGIDTYKIALIDVLEFVFDMIDDGYITLEGEMEEDLEELRDQLDDGKHQLESEKYSRIIMELNVSEESEETFEFLDTARNCAKKYYGDDVLIVGNATNNFDLASTFAKDNIIINILTVVFVLLVLFFTFQSSGIPIILILVIQGSVWINFSFPTIQNSPLFFMSYLVVSSIQMGANIDYAIVITNRYVELRREKDKISAIKEALNMAFPTIFTSGTILSAAGFSIAFLSSDPSITSIGLTLGRGTVISIVLVMGILPQLLVMFDKIIEKTSFSFKDIRNHVKAGGKADEK